jgi:ABC-2 type transport system ATP-binding protein
MVLEAKNIVKRYSDVLAVDNVSLSIREGEIYGLLGPNGAGKTTTINTILGLTKIDSGNIKVFGMDFDSNEMEIKRNIGIVPQDISVFEDLTAYENAVFFGKLYGLKGSLLTERVKEALEFTGIWDKRKIFPKKFSGGMKRRLNIACAIVHQPKLIIMDEPTVGIDPQSRKHILDSVRELNKRGSTVIYTSHYMEEVEELCSYITIMDNGRIIASGTNDELKEMVSSDERLEIEVSGVSFTLTENLKKIEGVRNVSVNEGKLSVTAKKNGGNLSKVINAITESGNEILSLNVEKPTLETVFLTLTGRTLRD